jgi:hypothetical protein
MLLGIKRSFKARHHGRFTLLRMSSRSYLEIAHPTFFPRISIHTTFKELGCQGERVRTNYPPVNLGGITFRTLKRRGKGSTQEAEEPFVKNGWTKGKEVW